MWGLQLDFSIATTLSGDVVGTELHLWVACVATISVFLLFLLPLLVRIYPPSDVPMCGSYRHLCALIFCCVIVVWLVNLREPRKESSRSALMLRTHYYFFSTMAALFPGSLFWFVSWFYDYVLLKEEFLSAVFPPILTYLKISIYVFTLECHYGLV